MKPKPYGTQNTKFLEYERSSLIPLTSSELLKFENRTSVIIEISRFSWQCNEGIFVQVMKAFLIETTAHIGQPLNTPQQQSDFFCLEAIMLHLFGYTY